VPAMPVPYETISEMLQSGSVVPFLGAGASLLPRQAAQAAPSAGAWVPPWPTALPTGNQLREFLAHRVSLPLNDGAPLELATVAQYYTFMAGRPDLYQNLHKIFTAHYDFGPVHALLAQVKQPLLVLTTNYDDMLEKAFTANHKPFDLVVHQTNDDAQSGSVVVVRHDDAQPQYIAPNHVEIDLSRTSVIYKMHGTVACEFAPSESFVITEDDYLDFLIRMGSNTPIPSMIEEAFLDRHFLFLGYGLADWNFRVMLASLKEHLLKRPGWAIRWQGSVVEEQIWSSRGVRMFDLKVDDFVQALGQAAPTPASTL
jgi:SIR2-like domain